ncbi:MAG: agmatine deiminase family protein [Anaerolineales bacterium]|nr:agmatine deiminase family protein [Anaerolineales bacterium]
METKTPLTLGYQMPAEWEPHEGTWLIWPHNDTHEDSQLHLEHLWLEMTMVLHEHEIVHIIVPDDRRREHLHHQLIYFGLNESKIDVRVMPNDDVWVRDCGPIFLVNPQCELAVTSWNFNGWGERYPFGKDHLVPERVADELSLPLFIGPIILEGGAIEVNGSGTLIATRSSIINPNRNPGVSQEEIEAAIKDYLGIQNIIWLSGASREFCDLVGSDTDLHVDGYARFTDESTVLYSWTDDDANHFYPILNQHFYELRNAQTESGKPLKLVCLPKPRNEMYSTLTSSMRPPFERTLSLGTYANFYIANNVVLVPVYGDINDANAKSIIAEHFPNREIIGIPAWQTSELGGMMHCVTQQQPLAKAKDGSLR